MKAFVSMIRGINVGGRKIVKMDALKALHESLGLKSVKTFLQSGNVVFLSDHSDSVRLARRIEEALEKRLHVEAKVVVRSVDELRQVVRLNPLGAGASDASHLLVMFLAGDPAPDAEEDLARVYRGSEKAKVVGRECYLYYPNGIARSKLTHALLEKTLQVAGTARNWNTVTKLLDLTAELSMETR